MEADPLGVNVPFPLPRKTETELEPAFPTARSSLPSPLKSAVAIPIGPF